jgi:ParB-like nuclease domain
LVNIAKVAARRVEPDPAAGPFGGMHSDLAAGARSVEEVEARARHEALIERLARAQTDQQDQLGKAFQGGGFSQFQSGLSGMAGPMGSALQATFPSSGMEEPSTWQDRYAASQRAFKRRLYEGEQEPGGGWAPWAAGTGAGMLGYGVGGGRTLLSNLMTGLGIGGVQGGVQGFADPAEGSAQERLKNAALYALGGGLAGGLIGGAGHGLTKAAPQAFNWLTDKLSGEPEWRMSSDRDRLAEIAQKLPPINQQSEMMNAYRGLWELVPIDWLSRLPGNALRNPTSELMQSIRSEGLRDPLIINAGKLSRTAQLGEGNHRLAALRDMGFTHAPARVIVGSEWGKNKFGSDYDADLIPLPDRYFRADAPPSEVFRSLRRTE